MSVHEIKGYCIVLARVAFVTRVFEARDDEGFQFNVQMSGDTRLAFKYPDRAEATLARELLVEALKSA